MASRSRCSLSNSACSALRRSVISCTMTTAYSSLPPERTPPASTRAQMHVAVLAHISLLERVAGHFARRQPVIRLGGNPAVIGVSQVQKA